METRKIPIQNYIVLGFIVLATLFLLYYFVVFYKKQGDLKSSTHPRLGILSELKESEIQNYIEDNPDAIIYISDSTDNTYYTYEKELASLMRSQNIVKNVVYLDMHKVSSKEKIKEILKLEKLIYPNVFIISDDTTSVLYLENGERDPMEAILYIQKHLEEE